MKLAVFGTHGQLEDALKGLELKPEEVHVPSEFDVEATCKPRKITVKKYGIDWDSTDLPNALVKTNKNGKEYNARAPMMRNQSILDNASAVLILGDDQWNANIEKNVSYMKRQGCKIDLLKWPQPKPQPKPEPQQVDVSEDDIPF